ncbi:hypothetical protein KCP78_04835 [Salmonella enterica subsp. enterica]|nr:hypothetical protein KCP78_04835 [Salmonella enterica subsp. enterica]
MNAISVHAPDLLPQFVVNNDTRNAAGMIKVMRTTRLSRRRAVLLSI